MTFRLGSQGPDVEALQRKLTQAGYEPGACDGDYGAKTSAAVLEFQKDRPDLEDDGIAGPHTLAALDGAVSVPPVAPEPAEIVPCNAKTMAAFELFQVSLTGYPVRYGPGRGLWVKNENDDGGRFVATYGAGKLGGSVSRWPNVLSRTYPSFHCTSLTNMFLAWLLRRNQDFTHAGNIPSLFDLMKYGWTLRSIPDGGSYRGYGDEVTPIKPDGTGAKRIGYSSVMDAKELLDRARKQSLPTFIIFAQSTKKNGKTKWWHHTGIYVAWEGRLFRFAADGYKGSLGYSAQPLKYVEITEANVHQYASAFYSCWGVDTADGSYGDQSRPIASIDFER